MWRRAWVDGVDQTDFRRTEPYRLLQNQGNRLADSGGTADWTNYQVDVAITPHMIEAWGIGARVQGMRRYYALMLCISVELGRLAWSRHWTAKRCWPKRRFPGAVPRHVPDRSTSDRDTGSGAAIDGGEILFEVDDTDQPLPEMCGVALIATEGRLSAETVFVRPPTW